MHRAAERVHAVLVHMTPPDAMRLYSCSCGEAGPQGTEYQWLYPSISFSAFGSSIAYAVICIARRVAA